ncbi:pyridoxal phosphate-dependent aminotransferase [Novosphingobium sp. JCM 18896]|uniref:pyridoxal phosphate-dependent aminotransferase n=1 Tax=Novosphingobium sp. JCM 18896 TaxID=2989731 RepID=UPI002223EBBA|nr:pyridoxal phosphate-dependent aminotransferase [Novosphingobium sp. JCM 18896]MCW1431100.1 pyridoxal phosphate-dependent aminotransferase [Novosphingobium sp. JCM 18896]
MMDEAPGTYTQWVRQAIGLARARKGDMLSLFESSVPEPRELLREAVAATAVPELSRYYVSAFSGGNPFIREMLAAQYQVPQDHVICTTGATSGLALIYRACLAPGDRVLIETPSFDLFTGLAEVQGVAVDRFERSGERFTIDPAAVEAKLHPRTRLVVISNLHNPSGMPVDHAGMKQLADLAERRGFLLVVDEVYADYAGEGVWPCPAQALSPAVLSLSSLTKIYGLGTLRCGWIVGAPEALAPIRRLSESTEFGVSTLSHAVAAQVMANRAVFDAHSRDYVARCRPVFDAWFARVSAEGLIGGLLPDDGCICFPSLPGVADARAFSRWLIERSGVLVAPGEYFGTPGRIRLGFCLDPERLTTGLAALEDGLRAYRDRASAA